LWWKDDIWDCFIYLTAMRELKANREEVFSRAYNLLYEWCEHCTEQVGTTLYDYINIFYMFCVVFYGLVWELRCHSSSHISVIFFIVCKIWGFHSGDYEERCLLGC
jgi:hypothetical protein